jgi:hypothetical protein
VTRFVAGARGDAEAWRFEVLGHEALELPAGTVPKALQMRREPTRPYDTWVEVWLDPARQHLPVCAVFTTLPGGQPLQLELAAPDIETQAGLEKAAAAPTCRVGGLSMQMLYNSDSFAVLQIEFGLPETEGVKRGGFEIVDKFARKGIFIEGAVAQSFKDGVQALIDSSPTQEALDEYIAGYTTLAQQPVNLH